MVTICEMCKLLNNPLRVKILLRTYAAKDGMNVGLLADELQNDGIGISGVSQYMKQLERIGVIRRVRAGRYVNYVADSRKASKKVCQAIDAIVAYSKDNDVTNLQPTFAALMNPFRATIIAALAKAGSISAVEIAEKTIHQQKHLKRDLQAAVDAGLIDIDDSEVAFATCHYCKPTDPIIKLLVALLD